MAAWTAAVLAVAALGAPGLAQEVKSQDRIAEFPKYTISRVPFQPGERMEFDFTWNGIPAATGISVVEKGKFGDREAYRFKLTARTTETIDTFWKMRSELESFAALDTLSPLKYVLSVRQNSKHRVTTVLYDHNDHIAKSVRQKFDQNKVSHRAIKFQSPFDPIAVAYFVRCLDLNVGDEKKLEMVDGRNIYLIQVNVAKKEEIAVKAGKFRTLKTVPKYVRLTERDEFTVHEAFIWLTDDERRIPVKLESKVVIGSVCGELARYERK